MGIGIGLGSRSWASSSNDCTSCKALPNPDPNNYIVISNKQIGNYLILQVNYPDCSNFSGNKILVYEGITYNMLKNRPIDPHFLETKISPIARFQPTTHGMDLAKLFCNGLIALFA